MNISEITFIVADKIVALLQSNLANPAIITGLICCALVLLLFVLLIRSVVKRGKHVEMLKEAETSASQEIQLLNQRLFIQEEEIEKSRAQLRVQENLPAQLAAKHAESIQLRERLEQQASLTEEQRVIRDSLDESLNQLRVETSQREARLRAEQQAMEEKLTLLQENKQQLSQEFQILANKIFDEKSQSFNQSSKQVLDHTLSPLKTQLESFRKRVDDAYNNEAKERHLLKSEIEKLRGESLRISEDASNLTKALKADNKTQGNWGELTLIRALETCGLTEPNEFETQLSFETDERKRQIPDVIVHLPGGKDIVIDSKVSLLAYARYFEAETEEQQQLALKSHLHSIKEHIKELSAKSYQNLDGINTLDYVMMYIPIEGASAMALQSDRDLWEQAYSKNIVLVSPTNLLAILRSVETIWRHEKQNKNAEEIARQAGNLHEKFVGLIKTLDSVGRSLEKARSDYDRAYGQLTTGKGNLVSRVQNLEKLGAKTKSQIGDSLLRQAEADEKPTSDDYNAESSKAAQEFLETESSVDE